MRNAFQAKRSFLSIQKSIFTSNSARERRKTRHEIWFADWIQFEEMANGQTYTHQIRVNGLILARKCRSCFVFRFATGAVCHCYAMIIDVDVEPRILVRIYRSNRYTHTRLRTVAIIISSKWMIGTLIIFSSSFSIDHLRQSRVIHSFSRSPGCTHSAHCMIQHHLCDTHQTKEKNTFCSTWTGIITIVFCGWYSIIYLFHSVYISFESALFRSSPSHVFLSLFHRTGEKISIFKNQTQQIQHLIYVTQT